MSRTAKIWVPILINKENELYCVDLVPFYRGLKIISEHIKNGRDLSWFYDIEYGGKRTVRLKKEG